MKEAITRKVPASLPSCLLTHLERESIDVDLARRQHADYEAALRQLGITVRSLPALDHLADSVFVEDTVVVTPELAVITRLGALERRPENARMAAAIAPLRRTRFIDAPGTIDGGDVVRLGRTVLVGISGRTDASGAQQLADLLEPFGYSVDGVVFRGCLHLKSACVALSDDTLLANPNWVDISLLPARRILCVARSEPFAANVLAVDGRLVVSVRHPETRAILERAGFPTNAVDISEMQKAEGALTCMSVLL